MKKYIPQLAAFFLGAFGLLALFLTSSIVFDWFGIREKEGNYVLVVVYANMVCGFLYLLAAYGFLRRLKWTAIVLGIAAIVLLAAILGLVAHINSGGLYETKTIGAMVFRISVTTVFALLAYFSFNRGSAN